MKSGRARESHPEVQEGSGGHPEVWEGLEIPPTGPGRVGRPIQRSGRGRKVHRKVREGSGVPPGGQGGVGRPTHPEVREGYGG